MGSGASRTRSDSSKKSATSYQVEEKVSSRPTLANSQASTSGDNIPLFTSSESDGKQRSKESSGNEDKKLDSDALGTDVTPMKTGESVPSDAKADKAAANGDEIHPIAASTGVGLSVNRDSKQTEAAVANFNTNVPDRDDASAAKESYSGVYEAKSVSPRLAPPVDGVAPNEEENCLHKSSSKDGNRSASQSEDSSYNHGGGDDGASDDDRSDAENEDEDEDEAAVLAAIRASRLDNRSDFEYEDEEEEGDDYAYGSEGLGRYGMGHRHGHGLGARCGQSGGDVDDDDEGLGEGEGEERDEEAERENDNVADLFACTAMSLGMDHEELLFNMMYFGGGGGAAGAAGGGEEGGEEDEADVEDGVGVHGHMRRGGHDGEENEVDEEEEERDEYGYGSPAAVGRRQVGFGSGGRGGTGDADDNSSVRSSGDRSAQSGSQRFRGGNNGISMLRTMLNNTVEETIAAHSANNTPYKLKPADEVALKKLLIRKFNGVITAPKVAAVDAVVEAVAATDEVECMVCRDTVELGDEIIELTDTCGHLFHAECITRWLKMQSWCPVCRTSIASTETTYVSPSTVTEVPTSVGKVSPGSGGVTGTGSGVGGGVCKNKPTSSGGRCGSSGSNNGTGHSPRAFAMGAVGSSSAASATPHGVAAAATGGDNTAGLTATAGRRAYGYDEEGELDRRTLEMLYREMGAEMNGFDEHGVEDGQGMGPEDRDSASAAGEAEAYAHFHAQLAADFAAASGGLEENEDQDGADGRDAHFSAKQRAAAVMSTSAGAGAVAVAVASGGNSLRASPSHCNYEGKSVQGDER